MLEARDLSKAYGGVVALDGADFTVRAGSVHALLGENGAGKSTLVKIIAGALEPDGGSIALDGSAVRFSSTADAVRHGVAVVSQELNLFPDLDVLANLYPMRELKRGPFVDKGAMAEQARPVLRELGLDVPLHRLVGDLPLAERQLLEIAKALLTDPRVLILDEPTSALGQASTELLLDTLRVLRDRQVGVVFVSHILEDVMALCDEVTVLRDGRVVMSARPRAELTVPAIVDAMLGDVEEVQARAAVDVVAEGSPGAAGRGGARAGSSRSTCRSRAVRSSGSRAWRAPATTPCSSWSPACAGRTAGPSCFPPARRSRPVCGGRSARASRSSPETGGGSA